MNSHLMRRSFRVFSTQPSRLLPRKYGELLFQEKIRKCENMVQFEQILSSQPQSEMNPSKCLTAAQKFVKFRSTELPTSLISICLGNKSSFSPNEFLTLCLEISKSAKPEMCEPMVRELARMDFSSFSPQQVLDTLFLFKKISPSSLLDVHKILSDIIMKDVTQLSVGNMAQFSQFASPLHIKQLSKELQSRNLGNIELLEMLQLLDVFVGQYDDKEFFAKFHEDTIQIPFLNHSSERLSRYLWRNVHVENKEFSLINHASYPNQANLFRSFKYFQRLDQDLMVQVSNMTPPTKPEEFPKFFLDLLAPLNQLHFSSPVATSLVQGIAQELSKIDLAVFPPHAIMSLLQALAKYKVRDSGLLENILVQLVRHNQLDKFSSPQELTLLIWHFEKLNAHSLPLLERITERLITQDLSSLTQKYISQLLLALSRFNHRNPALLERLSLELQRPGMFQDSTAYHILNLLDFFVRLRYMNTPESTKLFDLLLRELKTKKDISELSEMDASSLLKSMARLQLRDVELTEHLTRKVVGRNQANASFLSSGEVAEISSTNMVTATTTVANKPPYMLVQTLANLCAQDSSPEVLESIESTVKVLLHMDFSLVSMRDISQLLRGFQKQLFVSEPLFQKLEQTLLQMEGGSLRERASILVSFGVLRFPSEAFFEDTVQKMGMDSMEEVDVATLTLLVTYMDNHVVRNTEILQRIATELEKRDFSEFSARTIGHIARGFSHKCRISTLFEKLNKEMIVNRKNTLDEFSVPSLCEIAHSLRQVRDPEPFLRLILPKLTKEEVLKLKPKTMAELCSTLAEAKFVDPGLFQTIGDAICHQNLADYSLPRLSGILQSFSELRVDHQSLFSTVMKHVLQREDFSEIRERELVTLLSNFAHTRNNRAFFATATSLLNIKELKPNQLATVMQSYSKAKYKDVALCKSLLQEIEKYKFEEFAPTKLVQILRAFESFDFVQGPWLTSLAGDLKNARSRGMV